ncbi:hypothetical protein GCM10008983_07900 [Lentibacillus halophilus]|uniref:TRAP C4-dicarboxylate transport system permease DctM subunit domain-containing protein n=1 Tax=Lentibacillus halophilus TaxID=295065 RepID=A0ABN0Z587_9BACI
MASAVLFGSLFILIFISVPIGISIGLSTLITIIFVSDNIPLLTVAQKAFTSLDSFPLMAIPFFMFAGLLMGKGGVSKRLLEFAGALVGFLVGGLAMVTVLTCMFFAAISGSGPATVAAIGSFMIPAMEKKNYGEGFSSAITATAGSIGVIIPPSIPLVLFGVVGSVSIGSLFMAGILPGILIGIILMITSYLLLRKKGIEVDPTTQKIDIKHVLKTFYDAKWALLAPVIILGGIYGSIFTPTEAAAVAIIYAYIVGAFIHKELKWKDIYSCIMETSSIMGSTLYMIGLSIAFAYILNLEQIPQTIANFIIGFSGSDIVVLLLINLFLIIVGAFVDTIAALVILTPILLPIATQIGMEPVQFGVVMILNLAIGYITPPLGVNLFVASAISKRPIESIAKAAIPLFLAMLLSLLIVSYVSPLTMFLPNLMN